MSLFGNMANTSPGHLSTCGRKRRRPALACDECRRRKIKCDRAFPCGPCIKSEILCIYSHPNLDERNRTAIRNHLRTSSRRSLTSLSPSTISTPLSDFGMPFGNYGDGILDSNMLDALDPASMAIDTLGTENDIDFFSMDAALGQPSDYTPSSNHSSDCGRLDTGARGTPIVTFTNTRVLGRSHWETAFDQFEMIQFLSDCGTSSPADSVIQSELERCKQVAKTMGNEPQSVVAITEDRDMPLCRELDDKLVDLYFQTFGAVLPTLHRPSFQQEYKQYWKEAPKSHSTMSITVSLVLAIGSSVYGGLPASYQTWLHSRALRLMQDVHTWFKTDFRRLDLSVQKLQTLCLLLVAQQVFPASGSTADDESCLSADTALRLGSRLGLHVNSTSDSQLESGEVGMRRSIWGTIMELSLQSSLDMGDSPGILLEQADTAPLLHASEAGNEKCSGQAGLSEHHEAYCKSPIQSALMRSMPVRLKIVKLLNRPDPNLSYEEVLQLDSELAEASRASLRQLRAFSASKNGNATVAFQMNLHSILTRRVLLALHLPFAGKSIANPAYYFSRHVCRETSLQLLDALFPKLQMSWSAVVVCDTEKLLTTAGGVFKSVLVQSTAAVCVELIHHLKDAPCALSMPTGKSQQARNELREAMERPVACMQCRIIAGDTDVRPYVLFCSALGQIKALEAGGNEQEYISKAARESLKFCYHVLQSRTAEPVVAASEAPGPGDMSSYSFSPRPGDEMGGLMGWTSSEFIEK